MHDSHDGTRGKHITHMIGKRDSLFVFDGGTGINI